MACGGCNSAPEYIETWDEIWGNESHFYEVYASAGETMFVDLYGDGNADLDVIVTDERGRVVAEGSSYEAWEEIDWVARREGVYTIEVINIEARGCSEYDLSVY